MSLFGDNLLYYRKRNDMTQEQLAERLEVSRQTVSKWEAGTSYAEMEKLLQLCDLFSCSLDTLLRKDASKSEIEDNQQHRKHMKEFRRWITCGVAVLIFDAAFYELLEGWGRVNETMQDTLFMMIAIVGILILVVQGLKDSDYRKKHPVIQVFYTMEEKERFDSHFPAKMASGVGVVLIGMLVGMNAERLPLQEYDVEAYNRENDPNANKKNTLVAVWCGCIMLFATILFLIAGLVFHLWEICWLVYPIGGMLCGMATLILNRQK